MDVIVTANLLFFGKARELANKSSMKISVPAQIKCEHLRYRIFNEIEPSLKEIEDACIIAVSERYYSDLAQIISINENCEIVVCPPLSGG